MADFLHLVYVLAGMIHLQLVAPCQSCLHTNAMSSLCPSFQSLVVSKRQSEARYYLQASAETQQWKREPFHTVQLTGISMSGVSKLPHSPSKSWSFATTTWATVSYLDRSIQYYQHSLNYQMLSVNILCKSTHEDMPRIHWCTGCSIIGQHKKCPWYAYYDTGTEYYLDSMHSQEE